MPGILQGIKSQKASQMVSLLREKPEFTACPWPHASWSHTKEGGSGGTRGQQGAWQELPAALVGSRNSHPYLFSSKKQLWIMESTTPVQNPALLKYKTRIMHKTLVNIWEKKNLKASKRREHILLFNPTLKSVELTISVANKERG